MKKKPKNEIKTERKRTKWTMSLYFEIDTSQFGIVNGNRQKKQQNKPSSSTASNFIPAKFNCVILLLLNNNSFNLTILSDIVWATLSLPLSRWLRVFLGIHHKWLCHSSWMCIDCVSDAAVFFNVKWKEQKKSEQKILRHHFVLHSSFYFLVYRRFFLPLLSNQTSDKFLSTQMVLRQVVKKLEPNSTRRH